MLVRAGDFGFQKWRANRKGERRRKTVQGCFIDRSVRVISLKVIRNNPDQLIQGLNDRVRPKTLGPKRASKIRKLFNLSKEDDVRKYVIKRNVTICKKSDVKGVKIQRLVTPERIRRKVKEQKLSMQRCLKRKRERDEWERKFKN